MVSNKRFYRSKYHANFYGQDGRRKYALYTRSKTLNSVLKLIPQRFFSPIIISAGVTIGLSSVPCQFYLRWLTVQLMEYEFQQLKGCSRLPAIFYRYSEAALHIKSQLPAFWLDNRLVDLLHTSATEGVMFHL